MDGQKKIKSNAIPLKWLRLFLPHQEEWTSSQQTFFSWILMAASPADLPSGATPAVYNQGWLERGWAPLRFVIALKTDGWQVWLIPGLHPRGFSGAETWNYHSPGYFCTVPIYLCQLVAWERILLLLEARRPRATHMHTRFSESSL